MGFRSLLRSARYCSEKADSGMRSTEMQVGLREFESPILREFLKVSRVAVILERPHVTV